MIIRDIIDIIERIAPRETALDFDNVGLLVGDANDSTDKVLVAVDVTMDAVHEASKMGAKLIISHHPIIFYPIKDIVAGDTNADIIMEAIRCGISLYAAHTNMDNAMGGITDRLMANMGASNVAALEEDGTGRVGELVQGSTLSSLAQRIKAITGDESMRIQGDMSRKIGRIALINGAGGRDESLVRRLKALGVDAFITGETKHSVAMALKAEGIALIDVEHYHAEKIFIEIVAEALHNSSVEVTRYFETNPYNM